MGSKSKVDGESAEAVSSCCSSSVARFAKFVADWQSPPVSVGCLVTVNAIYWIIMPMTSTLTLTAIIGYMVMLVDAAARLEKLPLGAVSMPSDGKCCCCLSKVWSSPCMEGYFPSVRSRARTLIGLASLCSFVASSIIGLQLSTIVYIGASIYLLSKPLHLAERSEFPVVARIFDSLLALRPDTTSICSTPFPSTPSEPVPKKDSPPKSPSLHFQVDPMELEITSPEKPSSTEHDELAAFMPTPDTAEEDLASNAESTEELSASLMPERSVDIRYEPDSTIGHDVGSEEDIEEFELVDSASETGSLSNMPSAQ